MLLFSATLFSISRNLSTYLYKNTSSKFLISDFEGWSDNLSKNAIKHFQKKKTPTVWAKFVVVFKVANWSLIQLKQNYFCCLRLLQVTQTWSKLDGLNPNLILLRRLQISFLHLISEKKMIDSWWGKYLPKYANWLTVCTY